MRPLSPHLSRVLERVLAGLLVALVLLGAAESFAWTVLETSWAPAEEISGLLQIWFALLAAAWVVHRGLHLRLEAIVDRLPPRLAAVFDRAAAVAVAIFGGLLAFYGGKLAATVGNTLPATGLGAGWQYVPAAVAGVLIALFAVEEAVIGRREIDAR